MNLKRRSHTDGSSDCMECRSCVFMFLEHMFAPLELLNEVVLCYPWLLSAPSAPGQLVLCLY